MEVVLHTGGDGDVKIRTRACRGATRSNDLLSHYRKLVQQGRVSASKLQCVHEHHIVGNPKNCTAAVDRFMRQEGWSRAASATSGKPVPLLEEEEDEDHRTEIV